MKAICEGTQLLYGIESIDALYLKSSLKGSCVQDLKSTNVLLTADAHAKIADVVSLSILCYGSMCAFN